MQVSLESAVVRADVQRVLAHAPWLKELAGQHLLVTGATGFFGKWLLATVAQLNEQGAAIQLTAVSREPERFLQQHPTYRAAAWLTWVRSDVSSLSWTGQRPVDWVLHAATDTSAAGQADRLQLFDSILVGARCVLELAVAAGAKRVLFTGSGAQYGVHHNPVRENASTACDSSTAFSAYAEGKRAQETLGALYAERHGIDVILTRCFAFSGPGLALDQHFAIGNFVRDALSSDEIVLQSNGEAIRSYLHGADLAVWLLTLLQRGEAGQAYNVGADQAVSIAELARRVVAQIAPHKPVTVMGKAGEGARSFYVPTIDKARGLGLDTWTSLDASITSMAQWAQEQGWNA